MFGRIITTERIKTSLVANLFGLQSLRYILAHIIYNVKFKKDLNKSNHTITAKKEGYCKISNFINNKHLGDIKKEFESLINSVHCKNLQNDGTNYLTVYLNDKKIYENYPTLKRVIEDKRVQELFCESENKKNTNIYCRLERIIVKDKNIEDTNKNFHYDTYHNTFKAWFYISESNDKNGPLVLIPGSHKFSLKRLWNSYLESIKFSFFVKKNKKFKSKNIPNNFAVDNYQYFRFKNKNHSLDKKANKLISNENTFLFVNTHCVHRRGDAEENYARDSIHFYSRENPFD